MKINRSLILIACATLATALIVGAAVYFSQSAPEQDQLEEKKPEKKQRIRKKKRPQKARSRRIDAQASNTSTNAVSRAEADEDEEANLTAAQKALLEELQEAGANSI